MLLSDLYERFPGGVILASASQPRAEILDRIGIKYAQRPTHVAEDLDKSSFPSPQAYCDATCRKKAEAIRSDTLDGNHLAIAADTIVIFNGVLEKVQTKEEALELLLSYSGKLVNVYTSVCLVCNGQIKSQFGEATILRMREYRKEEVEEYVRLFFKECVGGSGALVVLYSSARWIRSVDGCFYNAAGLPAGRLMDELEKIIYSKLSW